MVGAFNFINSWEVEGLILSKWEGFRSRVIDFVGREGRWGLHNLHSERIGLSRPGCVYKSQDSNLYLYQMQSHHCTS